MEMASSESLYHDSGQGAMKSMKAKMTLEFAAPALKPGTRPTTLLPPPANASLLASPDMQMLKLASPELERLIIQQNGMITTPTPTQVAYPRSVTEEQEAYARGFVDALAELHKTKPEEADMLAAEGLMVSAEGLMVPSAMMTNALQVVATDSMDTEPAPTYTTLNSLLPLPAHTATTTALPPMSSTVDMVPTATTVHQGMTISRTSSPHLIQPPAMNGSNMHIKEEPQIVPCMSSSPPLISPINMVAQEGIKCERKRARNRVAARKCRTRKLERISRLEDRVDELKDQNGELVQTAHTLRDQVSTLKKQIMQHVSSGCQVMLSQNLL